MSHAISKVTKNGKNVKGKWLFCSYLNTRCKSPSPCHPGDFNFPFFQLNVNFKERFRKCIHDQCITTALRMPQHVSFWKIQQQVFLRIIISVHSILTLTSCYGIPHFVHHVKYFLQILICSVFIKITYKESY